jgi:UDP-glucose 4-epimerase
MKILVTGAAGFIGSNIANTLSKEKNTIVVALDDLSLGTPTNLSPRVKFVKGSVMDYDLTLELGKGCDYIFHSAAKSSSPMFKDDPREGVDINVLGFMNVMESAKRNRAKKVICIMAYQFPLRNLKLSRRRHSMRHLFIVEKS